MDQQHCSGCKQTLPISDFDRNRTQKSGYSRYCKICLKNCRGRRLKKSIVCPDCGTTFLAAHSKQVVCSKSCRSVPRIQDGESNPNWRGGTHISSKGYAYVFKPDHPNSMKSGYVKRATMVLAESIGRPLTKNEMAHHINENKLDDRPENLMLLTHADHMRLHQTGSTKKQDIQPKILFPRTDSTFSTSAPVPTRHQNVNWPSDEELLSQRKTRTMQSIAESLGCSRVAVLKRLQKIQKSNGNVVP